MTNTEARKITFNECKVKCVAYEEDCENMLIGECRKRLEALEQEPFDDAISREDAEQMFRNIRSHLKPQDYKSAEEFNTRDLMLLNAEQMIHALPSVTQKSKTGHWIGDAIQGEIDGQIVKGFTCSKCGAISVFRMTGGKIINGDLCANCGAKMIDPQEKR